MCVISRHTYMYIGKCMCCLEESVRDINIPYTYLQVALVWSVILVPK